MAGITSVLILLFHQVASLSVNLDLGHERLVNQLAEAVRIAPVGTMPVLAAQQCRDYGARLRFRLEGADAKPEKSQGVGRHAERLAYCARDTVRKERAF